MKRTNDDLSEAARKGDEAALKALLLSHDCDPLFSNRSGMTALMWAAVEGQASCISLLLPVSGAGAQSENGMTALAWAAYSGHGACVQLLLAPSDAVNAAGQIWMALKLAARKGHMGCVQILLPNCDVLARRDPAGLSVADHARTSGHVEIGDSIDAYALALNEREQLHASTATGAPRKAAVLRV